MILDTRRIDLILSLKKVAEVDKEDLEWVADLTIWAVIQVWLINHQWVEELTHLLLK